MAHVTTGLDRALHEGPACAGLGTGARIGLAAHAASVDRLARHAVNLFHESGSWDLVRLFSPEHGLWGHEQDMEPVAGATDPATGLEVVSLYGHGAESLRPSPAALADLDAILVDFQDVGSRYYTYVYTLSYIMEAAGAVGLPVVVLDRPNPIGGSQIEGPVLDPSLASFVGRFPLPVRHGMTIGEMAGLIRRELDPGGELRVVEMRGWSRVMEFGRTGLPWVPPSPNMPTPGTARVYPGGCLLEGTNLSEGRGTTLPFEQAGAPWIDAELLARRLSETVSAGALFRAASFRPMFQKHAGQGCRGVQVIVTDPERFRPFATYLALIREARLQDVERFGWRAEPYEFEADRPAIDLLLGRSDLRAMIEAEARVEEMEAVWRGDLERFEATRAGYLLYD